MPADAEDQTQNKVQLTQSEQDFIINHPVIRLGVDPNFVPYEFIDTDGEYKGIAEDYINLICEKTGLKMEAAKGLTWSEAYEKAAKKELDVLPCVAKTKNREDYFLFTEPYFNFKRAVFVIQNNTSVKSFEDLYGKTVAVQEDSSHHDFLKNYPEIGLNLYSEATDALHAVSNGSEAMFVGNLATTIFLARENGIANLKYIIINTDERDPSQALHFAVRNDWPELVGIINKALAAITEEEKININNKWIGVAEGKDYTILIRVAIITGALIVIIMAVSFFWIIRLRKETNKRREAETGYIAAKEEAEKANHIKSMFLARMSHEIRTPLNAIMGMAYLIKKTEITSTQSSYLEKLTHAARNMLELINDILDFSKIEAGKIEIEHISFSIDDVIKRVVNIMSVKVEERGIELIMDIANDIPPFFWGDPVRLEQILLNLVNNAVKFTEKGSVTILVRADISEGNTYNVVFSVSDTGIGMTKEQLDRLFAPFDQGDSSINRRYGGTGLGLSIVKSLTELMKGKIEIDSMYGEGSVFTVTLPFEADSSRTRNKANIMSTDCLTNIKALIIDKNENSCVKLMQYCMSMGINSEGAFSEDEAVQRLYKAVVDKDKPYNLIIVDYVTPKNGGIDFITRIRRMSEAELKLKFILIIPSSQEKLIDEAEEAGVEFCVTKPVIPSVLYDGIIDLCCIKPPEAREHTEPEQIPVAAKQYHVLLVEDNKTNQFIAQTVMEQAGFKVIIADNGEEGYRLFHENRDNLDVILMDIHMPVMNGYDSADLIKKEKPDIPIIAMTADVVAGVIETCRSHGMENYVSKPFEPELFIKTIIGVLDNACKTRPQNKEQNENLTSVLNTEDGIKKIGGDRKAYQMVLRSFRDENTLVPPSLEEKIDKQDYEGAIQIAHKIKSSAGAIGAKSLHEAASELQKALKDENEYEINNWHIKFQSLLGKLIKEIDDILSPE
jgi:signal transduction histidine kinase/DNA-binding response OmpR family regulator